jgi:subtilisin family serine protease
MLRISFLMFFAMLFLASGVSAQGNGNGNGNRKAPIVTADAAFAIDDTWIVQTTQNVPTQGVRNLVHGHVNAKFRERYPGPAADGVTIDEDVIYNYESDALYGFTLTFAARSNKKGKIIPVNEKKIYHQLAVESLAEISGILNIEQDSRVEAWGHPFNAMAKPQKPVQPPPPTPGTNVPESPVVQTYSVGSTWGLDRIDSHSLTYDQKLAVPATGAGVTVYVVDTGIRTTHEQFQKATGGSRASWGWSAFGTTVEQTDGNGHGSHCAGTIGGKTTGVAREANVVAVQVLSASGSGSTSGCIAGVNWVANNAVKPAVGSMSLGGGLSSTFNTAVQNAVNVKGIPFAIAAGNDNADACRYSPASAPDAITVGATTNTDAIASYSNWGTCVDINAPGSSIYSAWKTSDTSYNTISGTSMATPHVAGVIALYLQLHPTATPAQVRKDLLCWATANKLTSIRTGTPNKLLYSKFGYQSPSTVTQCYV